MPNRRFLIVLALLIVCCVLAMIGTTDSRANLSSLLSIFSDAARDTDSVGMRLTRLSDADEMRVGAELTRSAADFGRDDPAASSYASEVAGALVPHVRRPGIRYRVQVIGTSQINALALPSGQIFVTSGLLRFARSEAELAAVLGHEISHVDLRHCVERYQYEYKLRRAGAPEAGGMVEMAHRLATFEFAPYQELEADAEGEALAIAAGYDPEAAEALFLRMKAQFNEPSATRATTPVGELRQAVEGSVGALFRSHPPSEDRARQLRELVSEQRGALAGKSVYVGEENLRRRMARTRLQIPREFRELRKL
jgi:predicted Zn-dependent protease